MMHNNLDELLTLIASKLDADEILDILGWTTHDLVQAIREQIEDNLDDFADAVRE